MNYIEISVFLVTFGVFLFNPIFGELMFYNYCVYEYKSTIENCRGNDVLNKKVIKDTKNISFYRNLAEFVPLFFSPFILNFLSTKFSPEKLLFLPFLCFLIKQIFGLFYIFYPSMNLYYFVKKFAFIKKYLDTCFYNCCIYGHGNFF